MSEPQYVAETLAWCNARRKEQGRKPLERLPKGKLRDPGSCPCGKATGMRVFEMEYRTDRFSGDDLPLPRSVTRFVRAFDHRRLPQYEAKS